MEPTTVTEEVFKEIDECQVLLLLCLINGAASVLPLNVLSIHCDFELAVHYAKFIPRLYFFHKKSRTISTVFLRNSTIMFKNKLCSCI